MGERTQREYGVLVDRTSKGLGYFLAQTFRDYQRAAAMANKSEALFGFPAVVKVRFVTTSDWEPTTHPAETLPTEEGR